MMPMTGKGEKTMNRYGIVRRGDGNRNMIRRPFRTFGDFMDSLFDVTSFWDDFGSFGKQLERCGRQGQMNRIALKKDGAVVGYRYEHALPGFTKDDIDITLDKGVMTVHASKGLEFPVVILVLGKSAPMLLTRNLVYTAVTRAKKMVVIIGEEATLARAIANTYTAKRYSLLRHFLLTNKTKAEILWGNATE